MTGRDAVAMVLLIVMLTIWDRWAAKVRCVYCGTFRGHTDHCPYQGTD